MSEGFGFDDIAYDSLDKRVVPGMTREQAIKKWEKNMASGPVNYFSPSFQFMGNMRGNPVAIQITDDELPDIVNGFVGFLLACGYQHASIMKYLREEG